MPPNLGFHYLMTQLNRHIVLILTCTMLSFFLLAGCGVKHRIKKHQDYFDKLPAKIQEKIQNKEIDAGFKPKMVYLAWGSTYNKSTRARGKRTTETWIYTYTGYDTETHNVRIYNKDKKKYETKEVQIQRENLALTKYVIFQNGKVIEFWRPNHTFHYPLSTFRPNYCKFFDIRSKDGCKMFNSMLLPKLQRLERNCCPNRW